jgi:Zn-dependent peptidase ImmA (M78 family)
MAKKRRLGRFTYAEDRKLIQMVAASATLEEAAARFGASVEAIKRKAKRLGLAATVGRGCRG